MANNSDIIIEIAVIGVDEWPLPAALRAMGVKWRSLPDHYWRIRWPDHYWRTRWIEGGIEVDHDLEINDTCLMDRAARAYANAGATVVWRYYPTGLD